MGRRSIFDKPMTPAERQRRHRAKKHAEQAGQLMEGLQPFDLADFVKFDPEDT